MLPVCYPVAAGAPAHGADRVRAARADRPPRRDARGRPELPRLAPHGRGAPRGPARRRAPPHAAGAADGPDRQRRACRACSAAAETPALRTFVRSVIQGESLGVSTGADHAQPRARDAQAPPREGRGARAEGAGQDALPADLPDLPGDVRRAARPGRLLDREGLRLAASSAPTAPESVVLRREDDGQVLCERCVLADTLLAPHARAARPARARSRATGIVLRPGWSIHTFFMRFPIDVVFVDADQVVLQGRRRVSSRGARRPAEAHTTSSSSRAGECARARPRGGQTG